MSLWFYTPTQQALSLKTAALAAAKRAVALAPERAEGRLALVGYYLYASTDQSAAVRELRQLLERAPNNSEALIAAAAVARLSGRWEESLNYARKAQTLDPRSVGAALLLGRTLLALRKYDEARAPLDLAVTLAPGDWGALAVRAMLDLAQGDVRAAREVLAKRKNSEDQADFVAFVAQQDYGWILEESQQHLLLTLSPEPFGGDRAVWGIALARAYSLRHDDKLSRAYADSARIALESALKAEPNRADLYALLAEALAHMGNSPNAEQAGKRAVALAPISQDAENGPYLQHGLGRVYILLGQQDKALDQLEPLLRVPYEQLSPALLRIDPIYASLRGNPRFERLLKQ